MLPLDSTGFGSFPPQNLSLNETMPVLKDDTHLQKLGRQQPHPPIAALVTNVFILTNYFASSYLFQSLPSFTYSTSVIIAFLSSLFLCRTLNYTNFYENRCNTNKAKFKQGL